MIALASLEIRNWSFKLTSVLHELFEAGNEMPPSALVVGSGLECQTEVVKSIVKWAVKFGEAIHLRTLSAGTL
jgi:hypothetical protein